MVHKGSAVEKTASTMAQKPTPEEALEFLGRNEVVPLYKYLQPLNSPCPDEVIRAEETGIEVLARKGLSRYGPYDLISAEWLENMGPMLEVLEGCTDTAINERFKQVTGLPTFAERKRLACSKFRLLVIWGNGKSKNITNMWIDDNLDCSKDLPVVVPNE